MSYLIQVQEKLQSSVLSAEESKTLKGKGCRGRRGSGCGRRGRRGRRGGGGCSGGGTTTTEVTTNITDVGTTPILGVGFDL
ncbi:MAG: hypothetical protein AB8H03_01815 [Saprospiraceae bacterium]